MPRKERGGKKTAKSKELTEATVKGQHHPRSEPTSETSRKRLEVVVARVALEQSVSKASPSIFPESLGEPEAAWTSSSASRATKVTVPEPVGPPPVAKEQASSSSSRVRSLVADPPPNTEFSKAPLESNQQLEEFEPIAPPETPKTLVLQGKRKSIVPVDEEIPKAKAAVSQGLRISDPSTLLRPQVTAFPVVTPSPPNLENATVRISVDLHGVLDLNSPVEGRWNEVAKSALANWLHSDHRHQAGVATYIGEHGYRSQRRRREALEEVRNFNETFNCDLRIHITPDRSKPELNPNQVSIHIYDRLDLARLLWNRGLDCILVNPTFALHHKDSRW